MRFAQVNEKSDIRATTRRRFVAGGVSLLASYASGATGTLKIPTTHNNPHNNGNASNASVDYGNATLPRGIRSRRIDTNNHVTLHILEAGFELVVAPDARGYGLSASQPVAYSDSLVPYSMFNRAGDVLGLVRALGHDRVAMVVGHDWGGPTAQWCARLRPDVFRSVVSISTPFLRSRVCADRVPRRTQLSRNKAMPPTNYFSTFCTPSPAASNKQT